jgi:transcription initiation factor TFIIA small subunit
LELYGPEELAMSYQLYRNTTLGHTLQESLDELVQYGQVSPSLANRILLQFDKSMNNALSTRVKSRVTFKAEKLDTYRFCDNVWTFLLKDVEFKDVNESAKVAAVKVVACDGKAATNPNQLPGVPGVRDAA